MRLRIGVLGVPGVSGGGEDWSLITVSVIAVLQHFASATARERAALPALKRASFWGPVFGYRGTGRRGQLSSSEGCGPPQ